MERCDVSSEIRMAYLKIIRLISASKGKVAKQNFSGGEETFLQ
jgi:hypothetical protein